MLEIKLCQGLTSDDRKPSRSVHEAKDFWGFMDCFEIFYLLTFSTFLLHVNFVGILSRSTVVFTIALSPPYFMPYMAVFS